MLLTPRELETLSLIIKNPKDTITIAREANRSIQEVEKILDRLQSKGLIVRKFRLGKPVLWVNAKHQSLTPYKKLIPKN